MTEKAISIFFLLFSSIYIFFAGKLSFGAFAAPKAGFLPILSGIAALILSLVVTISEMLQEKIEETDAINWRKFVFVVIGLIMYLILLEITGYKIATFIIMFYLLKVSNTSGWIYPCTISAGSAIGFYLVFERCLGTNLP